MIKFKCFEKYLSPAEGTKILRKLMQVNEPIRAELMVGHNPLGRVTGKCDSLKSVIEQISKEIIIEPLRIKSGVLVGHYEPRGANVPSRYRVNNTARHDSSVF